LSTIPTDIKTLVVKIGTALLSGDAPFDGRVLEEIVKDLACLKRERPMNVLIVSSGAIGCGMNALGLTERPRVLPLKQAAAAVGQATLMHYYETLFRTYGQGLKTAQVLLTASDLDDRRSYLNVRNTVETLFELGNVVPVVNENDSTATEELGFSDNDTLAAKMAAKLDADLLVILSDVDGLCDLRPGVVPSARLVGYVERITDEIEALAGGTESATSVGGMKTKLDAVKIACAAGVVSVIANGRRPRIVSDIVAGNATATVFGVSDEALSHRKRWIAFGRTTAGVLTVDDGARDALVHNGRSLLAAGIARVEGRFGMGAAVAIRDAAGREIARGLVNYASDEIDRVKGLKSHEIEDVLDRKDFDEIVHRNNLVVL